jgi:hypothetical protein
LLAKQPAKGETMTTTQFLKKYVPEKQRLEAEENLDNILAESRDKTHEETRNDIVQHLRSVINTLKEW